MDKQQEKNDHQSQQQARRLEMESLTKGIYHLGIAKDFLEDFKRSAKMEVKHKASGWVAKLGSVLSSIYESLTPKSRELFQQEIVNGDKLFFLQISELAMRMTPEQREGLERLALIILSGEKIEASDDKGQKLFIN